MQITRFEHKRGRGILLVFLSIAMLLAAHLTVGAEDSSVFISIRRYDGIEPGNMGAIERITREGFVPILSGSDGFLGYYLVFSAEDELAAVNLFETQEQALASNELAREFVVENLAPLLPNPPQIVEGSVDIGFVEMLHGMGDSSVSGLFAGVRIYDGFETEDLASFVSTVEDGFLPQMRESDGFFGYYLMHDDAGMLVAVSIFDSEASALASNEKARDFVAENLTAYLPENPLITSGRVGIAVLKDVNDGANLIDDMMDEGQVFVSIRVYDGVDPADQNEIARLVDDGFLPIMRESDGFVAYYLLPAGDMLAAVNLFDTEEQAAASNEKARDFVAESLAPLLPNPPLIVEGTIDVMYVADYDGKTDDASSLYASLRIYHIGNMQNIEESNRLVEAHLLPALQESGGLFSYYSLNDDVDTIAGLNVYASEENALAANDIAAAFVTEHMMDWLPDDPMRVSGQLGIAALAETQMGVNLIDDSVFASVRVYDGVDPANQDAIARLTNEGFLPIMRGSDGFVGYYLLAAGDKLAAVSLFDSVEQASASNEAAREFVAENLAPLLPNAPMIIEGPLSINYVAALRASDDHGRVGELHASIRFYEGFDLRHFDEANDLAISHLLPALQELGGLFAQFAFNDGEDTVVGISIFEDEEAALAANDAGKAFTMEYLADWAPNPPTGVGGEIAIAALAEIDMGANLIGKMMGDV